MSNPSKRKGTAFESAVVEFMRAHGLPFAERRALRGSKDCGDLSGVPGWTVEMKNCREMSLAGWMDEAKREAVNDGGRRHAVIHKRRGKHVTDAYVTVPLWLFCELVGDDDSDRRAVNQEGGAA